MAGALPAQEGSPPSTWLETGRLLHTSPDVGLGSSQTDFGAAVAIDGDTAIVGVPHADSAYVYERLGAAWIESEVLSGPAGFGWSVAIEDGFLVVGAPWDSSAHVFTAAIAGWETQAVLNAAGATCLGSDVDVSDGVLVAGDPCSSDTAYVFELGSTGWSQTTTVHVENEPALGRSVATDGQTVVAGGGLDSYLIERTESGWTASTILEGARGQAVDVSGDTLVAGGGGSGVVFERSDAGWQLTADLSPGDVSPFDVPPVFGADVAVAGDTIAVGAPRDDATPGLVGVPEPVPEQCVSQFGFGACVIPTPGAVYVFENGEGGWAQEAKLTGDPIGTDRFGTSVDLGDDDGELLAGAPQWLESGAQRIDAWDSVHVFMRVI